MVAAGFRIPVCQCPGFLPHPDASTAAASYYSVLVLLCVIVVLLAFHGARLVVVVWRRLRRVRPAPAAPDEESETGGGATAQSEEEQKRLARAVHRAMETKRLERMRRSADVLANVFPVFLLLQLIIHGGYLWTGIGFTDDRAMWRQVSLPMLYGAVVSTTWQVAPSLVTPLQVDLAHALTYVFFFVGGTIYKNNEIEFLHSSMWMNSVRIGFAVMAGNLPIVAASEGCFTIARIVFFYTSLGLDPFFNYAFGEMWVCASVIIICKLVESSRLAEVRSTVEARNSSQAESTVYSLLAAMCDAVLHVGHELQIKRPAPKLAGLLLMHDTVEHLKSSSLTDLMADDDKVRFRATAEDLKATTRSLNVHLRDAFGSLVGVRLFLARCPPNEDGEICQLVGVSIDEEPGADHVPERCDAAPASDAAAAPANVQEGVVENTQRAAGRGCRSFRSSGSEESVPLHSAEENEVAVWIEPDDDHLTVRACTVAFTSVCGPASSGSFSLLKAIAHRELFLHWFQHNYNIRFHREVLNREVGTLEQEPEPLDLILLPQKSCQKAIGITATCTFNALVQQDDKEMVKLSFHDLREVRVRRRAAPTSGRGTVRNVLASELPGPSCTYISLSAATISL